MSRYKRKVTEMENTIAGKHFSWHNKEHFRDDVSPLEGSQHRRDYGVVWENDLDSSSA